ncbi:sialic acid-binding Ig-like lectin 8 isoform X2 [Acinonyx jubatus]|uniref:Sialic acid-binding Ig-like lectin 8 isoform X2 n=1 Tax=Acinonyx jubatus TaxID=32536 RepID=A0ABM3P5M7_ACIJB|nr:sialic acid-binding Ig-like lectin 8 isoform X2 [Acinonyx jubatus]
MRPSCPAWRVDKCTFPPSRGESVPFPALQLTSVPRPLLRSLFISFCFLSFCLSDSQSLFLQHPQPLENGSSLSVLENQSLRLVCVVNSNPPARLSWAQGHLTLCSPNPGVLELPRVQERDEGEYTCRAQNAVGSQHVSLSLLLQRKAWPLSGRLLGAVGGAGTTAPIFLVLCIIIILVRSQRKKVTKPSVGTKNTGMESANVVTRVS